MSTPSTTNGISKPLEVMLSRASFARLRMRHRRIAALHLAGKRNTEIALATGFSPGYISHVLNRDDVKSILSSAYAAKIEQLVPKAIDALERNLRCGEPASEVRAADIALKASGRYITPGEGQPTAEDVIERVLERISPDGTTTRAIERRVLNIKGSTSETPPS